MARNDQRHGILRHGLTDVARRFRSHASLFRESTVGRRVTPAYATRGGVDLSEEFTLSAEIELQLGEVHLLAREVALRRVDCCRHMRRRRCQVELRQPAPQIVLGRLRRARWQHEARDARIAPRNCAETGRGLEYGIALCRLFHGSATVCRVATRTIRLLRFVRASSDAVVAGARPARPWCGR